MRNSSWRCRQGDRLTKHYVRSTCELNQSVHDYWKPKWLPLSLYFLATAWWKDYCKGEFHYGTKALFLIQLFPPSHVEYLQYHHSVQYPTTIIIVTQTSTGLPCKFRSLGAVLMSFGRREYLSGVYIFAKHCLSERPVFNIYPSCVQFLPASKIHKLRLASWNKHRSYERIGSTVNNAQIHPVSNH